MRRLSVLLIAALVTFSSAHSFADLSPQEEKRRTQLFKEGRAHADAEQWKEAEEKFRAVIELRSAPKALVALAFAVSKQGRLLEAKRLYEQAKEDAVAAKLKADTEVAEQSLRELLLRIPSIVLKVGTQADGLSVLVDGKPPELQFDAMDVEPGEHKISATAPGYQPFEETVKLSEGERKQVKVVLELEKPKEAPKPKSSIGFPPIGSFVLVGVAIGAGVTSVLLIRQGREQEQKVRDTCGGTQQCPAALKPEADEAATKIIVGDVLIGVGSAALVGAGVWWLLSGRKSDPSPSASAGSRVMAAPVRGGAWMGVESRF